MNTQLLRLSEMAINGRILHKLDLIGSVTIQDRPYFTVYRRYNNVHEMVVVDYNGDIYLQKDLPFSESIRRILCISDEKMEQVRINSLISFKHQAEPPFGFHGFLERTWSEIHESWFGVSVSLDGLFDTDSNVYTTSETDIPPPLSPFSSDQPLSDMDNRLVDLLLELRSSSSNPVCQPVKAEQLVKEEQPVKEEQLVKEEQPVKTETKEEEKKRTWSDRKSPPSSPRLTALAHQMILRNGRELRRKIS